MHNDDHSAHFCCTPDPPQLSSPIVNVTVNISDEITLSCQGFGNPRPVIEWYFTSQGMLVIINSLVHT